MDIAFDIITIIISITFLVKNVKRIHLSTDYTIYYIFSFLYVLPLILDYIFGKLSYSNSLQVWGFSVSCSDTVTRCIYDSLIILIQYVILHHARKANDDEKEKEVNYLGVSFTSNMRFLFRVATLLPILLIFPLRIPIRIAFILFWRMGIYSGTPMYYSYLERLSYIGIACSILLLVENKPKSNKELLGRIGYALCLYCNICIEGKRSAFIFGLMVFVVVMLSNAKYQTKENKSRFYGVFFSILIAGLLIIFVSIYFKSSFVNQDASFERLYEDIRIDLFRDDRVRLAIYSLLNPDKIRILDYPGQSLPSILVSMFPLCFVDFGTRYASYSGYLSIAVSFYERDLFKGYMTPTIFAELISNFSIIGMMIMPILCIWFSDKARKHDYPINILILISYTLIQMYSITYIIFFLQFTVLICIGNRYRFTL